MTRGGVRVYRGVKAVWLLMQAASLPLAALYLKSADRLPGAVWLAGLPFLLLWLIAHSLQSMYRFPLDWRAGLILTGGTAVQAAVVGLGGGSLTLAAYAAFFTSFTAVILSSGLLALHALHSRRPPVWTWGAAVAIAAAAVWLLGWLARPLARELSLFPVPGGIAAGVLMTAQIIGAVHSLYGFSLFAPPHPREDDYRREWMNWAAPTIIVLILSAATAAIVAGI